MKFNELVELLSTTAEKNGLEEDKTFLRFMSETTVKGTMEYIPAKYSSGSGYDPPEAFAEEYSYEETVDFNFSIYAVEKKPGKVILKVCDEEFDGDTAPGGIAFDGILQTDDSSRVSFADLQEKLGLDGDEEVCLKYLDKEEKLQAPKSWQIDVEKNVYGSFNCIFMPDNGEIASSMSSQWLEWKKSQIEDSIDPEAEVRAREKHFNELSRED